MQVLHIWFCDTVRLSSEWVDFLFPNSLSFPHDTDYAGSNK